MDKTYRKFEYAERFPSSKSEYAASRTHMRSPGDIREAKGSAGRRPSILYAFDEPADRWLFHMSVQNLNCRIHTAADSEEAIALYRQFQPDLILLDSRLPGRTWETTIRTIREEATSRGRRLHTIIVTA